MALLERTGRVRTLPVERVTAENLKGAIRENVDPKTRIMTDEHKGYVGIGSEFASHETVNHSMKIYVNGDASINTAESYFALLKRGVHGTFHHISRAHMHRYCDEFSFRWSNRKVDDGVRLVKAIAAAEGKRLMYREPSSASAPVATLV